MSVIPDMATYDALAYRLHQQAGGLPWDTRILVPAGEIVHLLNGYWSAQRRADVAEEHLRAELVRRPEEVATSKFQVPSS